MAPTSTVYHKDDKVFCFHHEILYEAKILDVRRTDPNDKKSPFEYLVHYKGWKNTWDDWVLQDRLRKLTDKNRELATTLRREAEAADRSRSSRPYKRRRESEAEGLRGGDDRSSSISMRGKRLKEQSQTEKEQHVAPKASIFISDNLKSLLVDDWENISKNRLLVPLPAEIPVNAILDKYLEAEKNKNPPPSQTEVDILEETVSGLREYFDKCLGRILLYKFEREQYHAVRKKWESESPEFEEKGPGDVYGAEHLARLLVTLPELIAQTNLGPQATNRLREELSKFSMWLSKTSDQFFTRRYQSASNQYIEKASGIVDPIALGTATARLS